MKTYLLAFAVAASALAIACNESGIASRPRATFAQLACFDVNGDNRLNERDAADPKQAPDFDADFDHDADDAAFFKGVDIPLKPERPTEGCEGEDKESPEYLVAHGFFEPAKVKCEGDNRPVLVVGVGGGVANLRNEDDAAGIRKMVDAILKEYDKKDVQTIGVVAGPALAWATNDHAGMEDWLTNAVRVYLERYPCLRVTIVGHSHGAITGDVAGARLEDRFADRIVAIVDVDRAEVLYNGDLQSRPDRARVFNIFETNDKILKGSAYESPNVENWDASAEQGPEHGQDGGKDVPINHTIIDNTKSIRERIVDEVMERST